MFPEFSQALLWLEAHPSALAGIGRGIEREALRIRPDGRLASTDHPDFFGSALSHRWITTDFAETLLEFITPVDTDVDTLLTYLRDIHRYVVRNLGDERLWPLSMPCVIDANHDIKIAQYGNSNIGRMKTLYRQGLKMRYGALMQTIAGVHYNFSLPASFWRQRAGVEDKESNKDIISDGYLRLIRNYYRFGWIIPYLFGASPAICPSLIQDKASDLPFLKSNAGMLYLPYATSLRLSDLGYTNKSQNTPEITFNDLPSYIAALKKATRTPSAEYKEMGLKNANGEYLQLNTNVLQIENELYAHVRPKRVTRPGETPSDALSRGGIEYVEVRSLDINPFSPIGIDANQVRFLDLFLIWCVMAEAPEMSSDELLCIRKNWNRVILEGRKPAQTIGFGCEGREKPLSQTGRVLFADLQRIAVILDSNEGQRCYQQVCDHLVKSINDPELTFSSKMLQAQLKTGMGDFGLMLAEQYRHQLEKEPLQMVTDAQFAEERARSWLKQRMIEENDTLSFEQFLASKID